ncbi:MAG: hypothetical protein WD555_00035 [Fulvivirga sp.]
MKLTLGLFLLLTASLSVYAQLDNSIFEQRTIINPSDSNALFFGINTMGFTKNIEYFNDIADGYTLFGYQLNPYFSYYPTANFRIDAGVYLQKDFGANGYADIVPTFSLKYLHGDIAIIFGNIEGNVSHRLIEPLYDFESVLVDRLENGVQLRVEKEKLFLDGWVEWQQMIYKGDPKQEEVTGGLSLNYTVKSDQLKLSIPVQFLVKHIGGQIDSSPAPLQTYTNSAAGISLAYDVGHDNYIQGISMDNYYVHYKDFSNEQLQAFKDGSGWYFNLAVKTRSNIELMASYWRGHEFISFMGGQLYPSVSSTFKSPWIVEPVRELFILRFMHNLKITDQLYLSTRVEPFYDLGNGTFEFSHGLYINYSTDFFLLKKRNNR